MTTGSKRAARFVLTVTLLAVAPYALSKTAEKSSPPPPAKKSAPVAAPARIPLQPGRPSPYPVRGVPAALPSFGHVPAPAPRFDPRAGATQPRMPTRPPFPRPAPPIDHLQNRLAATGIRQPYRGPYVIRTPHQPAILSQQLARCNSPAAPGCHVWGRLNGSQDTVVIANVARIAEMHGSSSRAWIGADGQQREVQITYTAEAPVDYGVVFVPAGAVVLGAGESFDTYGDATPENLPVSGPSDPPVSPGSGTTDQGPTSDTGTVIPQPTPPGAGPPDTPRVVQHAICRNKQETATVAGNRAQASEMQCRDMNGDWQPVLPASQMGPTDAN